MSMGEDRAEVVEIDAIAVEEWESDQHTPIAGESNLAALVKQSAAPASGPVRAPRLDDGWDDAKRDARADSSKPRTTTHTLRRTGAVATVPGGVRKTMALPTVAVAKPAPAKVSHEPAAAARRATGGETKQARGSKPAVAATTPARGSKPAVVATTPARGSKPAVAATTSARQPTPAVVATKPAREPTPAVAATTSARQPTPAVVATKPAREPTPAVVATKPAREPTPAVVATKPARQPTPAVVATKPAREPTPAVVATKPAREPTPAVVATMPAREPTPAVVATTPAVVATTPARPPTPVVVATTPARSPTPPPQPGLARSPTPPPQAALAPVPTPAVASPPIAMDLPAWPPPSARGSEPPQLPPAPAPGTFEDWDAPEARTSLDHLGPPPPVATSTGPRESSVIVDLGARALAPAEAPRGSQPYPMIESSETRTSASGVFSMPTTRPVGKGSQPEPAIADRASASAWNTPVPQAMPGEHPAAPPVPSFPSAAGLDYHGARQIEGADPATRHEPTEPRLRRRSPLATVFPTPHSRRIAVLAVAGLAVVVMIVAIAGRGGLHEPAATTADRVTTPARSTQAPAQAEHHAPVTVETPAVASAAKPAVAASEPVATVDDRPARVTTPAPARPAKRPARRRFSRSTKRVVVDYDRQRDPSSADSPDEALAKARAAYAAGNQHLFAGEADAAIASYRQALEDYPGYVAGYRGLGLAYAQAKNRPAAVDAFKHYVKLAPTARDVPLIKKRIANLAVR